MRELRPWLRLLQRHRRQLATGLLLMTSTLMAGLGLLALSGWFITATAITALAWAAELNASLSLYAPGGGIRFFALARTASRYFERLVNHDAVLRLLADIRVALFRKLLRAEAYSAKRLGSAAFLNRLVSDVDTLDNLYLRQIAPPLVALVGSLGAAGLIAVFAPGLSLVALGVLLPWLAVVTLGMAWWMRRHGAAEMQAAERLRSHALSEVEGMAELSAAGLLSHHQAELLGEEGAQRHRQMQQEAWAISGQALNTLVIHLLVAALLLFASQAWQAGQISGAVMVLIPLVIMALSEGFLPLPKAFVRWGATEAAAERLNAQGVAEPDSSGQPAEVGLPEHPTLTWSHIFVSRGVPAVFEDFSLSVSPGERLVITGSSGSGKSTLASLAARLTSPDEGQVMANGNDGGLFSLREWRERISLLTQDAHLFNESVAANLRVGDTGASDGQLWRVLEAVDLAPLVASLERGLEAPVGEGGGQLSGGEGRRLALARVLLRPASIVILDEPFTGLDEATAERVWKGIQPWLNGCSVVLMLHDSMPFIEADRVVALTAGRGEVKGNAGGYPSG